MTQRSARGLDIEPDFGESAVKPRPVIFALVVGLCSLSSVHCSSDWWGDVGCAELDLSTSPDVTVNAGVVAITELDQAADRLQLEWAKLCNAINADLELDVSQTEAAGACGVLDARIKTALEKGATASVTANYMCVTDASVGAKCQAGCAGIAGCDLRTACEAGELAVECNGFCQGSCIASSVACDGLCEGTCSPADSLMSCEEGVCEGVCDASSWEGTCETGCSASFSGTCGGACNGTCDGLMTANNDVGNCPGRCVGTCSASATGTCQAECIGQMTAGACSGTCKGSCSAHASVPCQGTCSGACAVPQGDCVGMCIGSCSAEVGPPQCEGTPHCGVDPNCLASCAGMAAARLECSGSSAVLVEGDLLLYYALMKHRVELAAVLGLAAELSKAIMIMVMETLPAIKAAPGISASGAVCVETSIETARRAYESINVSMKALASLQGGPVR